MSVGVHRVCEQALPQLVVARLLHHLLHESDRAVEVPIGRALEDPRERAVVVAHPVEDEDLAVEELELLAHGERRAQRVVVRLPQEGQQVVAAVRRIQPELLLGERRGGGGVSLEEAVQVVERPLGLGGGAELRHDVGGADGVGGVEQEREDGGPAVGGERGDAAAEEGLQVVARDRRADVHLPRRQPEQQRERGVVLAAQRVQHRRRLHQ